MKFGFRVAQDVIKGYWKATPRGDGLAVGTEPPCVLSVQLQINHQHFTLESGLRL